MHEMALAEEVLQIVESAAAREGMRRVSALWLEIGRLSAIEPEAMRFCFEAVARDSIAQGARLEIAATPGSAWCIDCAQTVELASFGNPCPNCGGNQLQVTAGTAMRVCEFEGD